jgi:hypothetical protein
VRSALGRLPGQWGWAEQDCAVCPTRTGRGARSAGRQAGLGEQRPPGGRSSPCPARPPRKPGALLGTRARPGPLNKARRPRLRPPGRGARYPTRPRITSEAPPPVRAGPGPAGGGGAALPATAGLRRAVQGARQGAAARDPRAAPRGGRRHAAAALAHRRLRPRHLPRARLLLTARRGPCGPASAAGVPGVA